MLKLYGFAYSNYYNIVKHVLIYKGVPFEEIIAYPHSPEILQVNPMGKAPAMITEQGTHLGESSVMLEYLEDAYPERPLYPADAEGRAQIRQLVKVSELYLELAARRLLPASLMKLPVDDQVKDEVRLVLDRGMATLDRLSSFAPYVAGAEISMADIYLRYALVIPGMIGPSLLDWNAQDKLSALGQWSAMMSESDISRKVDADTRANEADFMAYIASRR